MSKIAYDIHKFFEEDVLRVSKEISDKLKNESPEIEYWPDFATIEIDYHDREIKLELTFAPTEIPERIVFKKGYKMSDDDILSTLVDNLNQMGVVLASVDHSGPTDFETYYLGFKHYTLLTSE